MRGGHLSVRHGVERALERLLHVKGRQIAPAVFDDGGGGGGGGVCVCVCEVESTLKEHGD